jgi:hypothetical protein
MGGCKEAGRNRKSRALCGSERSPDSESARHNLLQKSGLETKCGPRTTDFMMAVSVVMLLSHIPPPTPPHPYCLLISRPGQDFEAQARTWCTGAGGALAPARPCCQMSISRRRCLNNGLPEPSNVNPKSHHTARVRVSNHVSMRDSDFILFRHKHIAWEVSQNCLCRPFPVPLLNRLEQP